MTSITLCMVVHNEEKTIGRILRTCKPFVDEIIICDQASTDKTCTIAKKQGALVWHTTRKGLADIDRQDCYNFATKDMIFVLDGDEMPDKNLIKFIKTIREEGPKYDVYNFSFKNTVDNVDIKEVLDEDWHPRLWVNKQPPVLTWPQMAHTYPKVDTKSVLFCTRGKINHIRTFNKIKQVTEERTQVIDPANAQREVAFLQQVGMVLEKRK